MQLTHALKWSFLSEIASKAVQPLVFVELARLLTPEDYGVVAAATMVISFSQIFLEAGMSKALIQYQGVRFAAANAAFWINIALGILVAGVLVAISSLVADHIFHDPRVPEGELLTMKRESRVYQGSPEVFADCPLYSRCCQSAKGEARTITTNDKEPLRQQMNSKIGTEPAKVVYGKRKTIDRRLLTAPP